MICKEIEKYDLYSGTNQLIEIVVGIRYWSVCVLLLQYIHLLKEIVFKQIKGSMMTMSQQTENLNRKAETENRKKNQIESPELKRTEIEITHTLIN